MLVMSPPPAPSLGGDLRPLTEKAPPKDGASPRADPRQERDPPRPQQKSEGDGNGDALPRTRGRR